VGPNKNLEKVSSCGMCCNVCNAQLQKAFYGNTLEFSIDHLLLDFWEGVHSFHEKQARVQHAPPRTKSHFLIQKSRHHLGRTKMKTSCYFLEHNFLIIAHVTLFVCKCHMASWKKSFGVDIQNCMGLVSKLLLFGLMSEPFVRFAISPPIRLRKILKAPPFVLFQNRDLKAKDT